MWARCARDMGEVQGRYGRAIGEMDHLVEHAAGPRTVDHLVGRRGRARVRGRVMARVRATPTPNPNPNAALSLRLIPTLAPSPDASLRLTSRSACTCIWSPLYLPHISPTSPYISPTSPPHLPHISADLEVGVHLHLVEGNLGIRARLVEI